MDERQAYRVAKGLDEKQRQDTELESALSMWEMVTGQYYTDKEMGYQNPLISTNLFNRLWVGESSNNLTGDEIAPEQHNAVVAKINGPSAIFRPLTSTNLDALDTARILVELCIYEGQALSPKIFQQATTITTRRVTSLNEYIPVIKLGGRMAEVEEVTKHHGILITVQKNYDAVGTDKIFALVSPPAYRKWMSTLLRRIKTGDVVVTDPVATIKLYASASEIVSKEQDDALSKYLGSRESNV